VVLAILLAQPGPVEWWHWIGVELVGGLVLGALIGWLGGRAMGWAIFCLPRLKLEDTGDGLVAVGVVLIAYATAQILGGNGFVAVFVTGCRSGPARRTRGSTGPWPASPSRWSGCW